MGRCSSIRRAQVVPDVAKALALGADRGSGWAGGYLYALASTAWCCRRSGGPKLRAVLAELDLLTASSTRLLQHCRPPSSRAHKRI